MDRRERDGDAATALLAMLQGWQGQLWTALPGYVVPDDGGSPFNAAARTVRVQPTIQARVQRPDGSFEWMSLPILLDCPVVFPAGGGVTLTFPIRAGDEMLVVFASRCIDAWWQSGGIQVQPELRMHDMSDGFAIPMGGSSKPNVIPGISTQYAMWRNDVGTTRIELDPGGGFINIITPGSVNVQAEGNITASSNSSIVAEAADNISASAGGDATVSASGNATVSAGGNATVSGSRVDINGELFINGERYLDHQHEGVMTGPANTGGVV